MADLATPSTLPAATAGYLAAEYWDKRFETEEAYEWFRNYEHFRHLVERECAPTDRVLVVGCGNSGLSEDLCRLSGLRHVVSTDASATVVEAMRARAAARGCTDIAWEVADLLALPYADATFDIVIEKGVLDCFLVDQRSFWQLDEAAQARVATVLSECHRVLTPRGALLSITFAAPHLRRPLLQRGAFTWRCAHDTFGDEWAYYFYTLRKGRKQPHEADADEAAAAAALRPVLPPGECMTQEHMDDESFLMGAMLDAD